jgi:predicted alpha-1,6-mannanase (GH76 family)
MRLALTRLAALGTGAAAFLVLALSASPAAAASPTASTTASTGAPSTASSAARSHANSTICDIYCDGRDPALATQDRVPVTATLDGRTIRLHLSDNDVMGWASIDGGAAGDTVWLDRSFDGGSTWSSGSKLGNTTTPSGDTGWRTLMYNVDDWVNKGVGALRACGQPVGQSGIACTAWARVNRNAYDRPTAAATGMMMFYDLGTGLFDGTGWWNSANALTAIIDNIRDTGMGSYEYAIATTYQDNDSSDFTNDYMDDTAWWGLAWADAYQLTGDTDYLTTAEQDADYVNGYWDSTCGGGVEWRTARDGKNAITNSLYLELNAELHNLIPGDTTYLDRAEQEWTWFQGTGMLNSSHLVNDGISSTTCTNNNGTVWSYNQGVLIAGLSELYIATGQSSLLTTAEQIGDAATTTPLLNSNGILTEPCESSDSCDPDGQSFKGAFIRGLGLLNGLLSDHPYTSYIDLQANTAYADDRDTLDIYGLHWAGPWDEQEAGRQQSALDLMNAATGTTSGTDRLTGKVLIPRRNGELLDPVSGTSTAQRHRSAP